MDLKDLLKKYDDQTADVEMNEEANCCVLDIIGAACVDVSTCFCAGAGTLLYYAAGIIFMIVICGSAIMICQGENPCAGCNDCFSDCCGVCSDMPVYFCTCGGSYSCCCF